MERQSIWDVHYAHPHPWRQEFPPLSVPDMLRQAVEAHPHDPMLEFMGRQYSYAVVWGGARRVAAGLIALGIRPGDRVGLFLPNVPHYPAAYYGAMMAGAIVVNFSPLYTVDELAQQVKDSGTRLLFTLSAKALLPTALAVLNGSDLERLVVGSVAGVLPAGKSLFYRLLKGREVAETPDDPRITRFSQLIDNDGACPPHACDPVRDVALLQYTGGTTGVPKGAMLTHQNITANSRQVAQLDVKAGKGERVLGVLPFFHIFANICVLNRTVHLGGEIVMLPRFDAVQALAAIGRAGITALPGVPTMFQALLDNPAATTTDFSTLQTCISGGAPLPEAVKAKFETLTGARLIEGYGLTEGCVVSTNPYAGMNKTGTIGQPIAGTHIRLVDRTDPHKDVAEGEPGELVVKGPQVMKGYWNRPDTDSDTFVDGWLRTGDVATIDEDGYIRIVDRLKDMISVGGFKVFPSQIEQVLYRHPAVKEALVIGIPDRYHGEMPKAFVTLQPDKPMDGDALMAWLNPQLGKHERVCAVEIRVNLPKTLVGKLSRKELVAEEKAKAAGA